VVILLKFTPIVALVALAFAAFVAFEKRRDRKAFEEGWDAALSNHALARDATDAAAIDHSYPGCPLVGAALHAKSWDTGYRASLASRGIAPNELDMQQLQANPYSRTDAAIVASAGGFGRKH
jgi:hypothetical protein